MPETFVIFHNLTLLHISMPSVLFVLFIFFWLPSCLLPRQRETKCHQGLVHLSRTVDIFDRAIVVVSDNRVEDVNIVCVDNFGDFLDL